MNTLEDHNVNEKEKIKEELTSGKAHKIPKAAKALYGSKIFKFFEEGN